MTGTILHAMAVLSLPPTVSNTSGASCTEMDFDADTDAEEEEDEADPDVRNLVDITCELCPPKMRRGAFLATQG
jgi:hypothetical protein